MAPELTLTTIGAVIVVIIASITDIRTGKIFNWLTLPGMLIGMIARAVEFAMRNPDNAVPLAISGLLDGFLGCMLGMLSLGIFKMTIMRQFGGGDIKLMGTIGAFVGPLMVFATFLYYCFAFGLYTCSVMALAFPWRQATVAYISKNAQVMNLEKFNQVRKAPLPVAPFIAVGFVATVIFLKQTRILFGAQ